MRAYVDLTEREGFSQVRKTRQDKASGRGGLTSTITMGYLGLPRQEILRVRGRGGFRLLFHLLVVLAQRLYGWVGGLFARGLCSLGFFL